MLWLALATVTPSWAVDGRPSIVIDAATGSVLHAEEASRSWYPASLTKLMTAYVVFDAIRTGELTLDTPLTYSANAAATPPSKMGFKPGTVVTVDNALKMLIVRSANDVAVMIAENLGGALGVDGFVRRMNAMAARLGMTGSRFINPHGLPGEGQVTTARDMALLAQAIYRDFPDNTAYFKIGALKFGKRTLRAYNILLARYDGADGMKTGFICSAGFNLVASATRGGQRLIVVVLGSTSGLARAETAARLMEESFTGAPVFAGGARVTQIGSRLGEPVDLRPEICGPRRVAKATPSESDGLDGEGDKGEVQSVLAEKPAPIEPVTVFIGPNPDRKDEAPIALALNPLNPVPLPSPFNEGGPAIDTLDPAKIVQEVRRAVAGNPIPRDPFARRPNLAASSKATTPPSPADRPTPSLQPQAPR
ncbi:D-alanyl-D-alanine carboxypeptidase family protein [Agaricicola taiwanensis]|nr:D-alanyl-D-alanine carboxypeptidase family protein [Agaricicola taiwanensis]